MDIRNMPNEAAYYEFVVAIPNADHYTFLEMYADGHEAERVALEYGGIVIHNVRIQGYQPPKREKKYYTFSGTWSWNCLATDIEDAEKQFSKAYDEDIDIDYEHQIKVNYDLP